MVGINSYLLTLTLFCLRTFVPPVTTAVVALPLLSGELPLNSHRCRATIAAANAASLFADEVVSPLTTFPVKDRNKKIRMHRLHVVVNIVVIQTLAVANATQSFV